MISWLNEEQLHKKLSLILYIFSDKKIGKLNLPRSHCWSPILMFPLTPQIFVSIKLVKKYFLPVFGSKTYDILFLSLEQFPNKNGVKKLELNIKTKNINLYFLLLFFLLLNIHNCGQILYCTKIK